MQTRALLRRVLTVSFVLLLACSCDKLGFGGKSKPNTPPQPRPKTNAARHAPTPLSRATTTQLKEFCAAKERQARALYAGDGVEMPPQMVSYYAAAAKGDWRAFTNAYEAMYRRAPQYENKKFMTDARYSSPAWQTVNETSSACLQFIEGNEKYALAFADDIITSIPHGSIYFGGTDPGRFLPTAFIKSHTEADPFFVLTQNALADGTYLKYLESMFTGKIYTPTANDSQRCFQEYMTDAQARMQKGQLKPGEDVRVVDNRVQVSGQVAVMAINALLVKVIFEKNLDREFFIEESFPLDWMYPHLTPHQLIMKINRKPVPGLTDEIIQTDRAFWERYTAPMIGTWLRETTAVREVCDNARAIHVQRDFRGGDPQFDSDEGSCKAFSKLRSSIAGLYTWRAMNTQSPDERARMNRAADYAFRQAFALCPYSPEAVFRYVQLLAGERRFDDAIAVGEAATDCSTDNQQFVTLLNELKRMKRTSAPQ